MKVPSCINAALHDAGAMVGDTIQAGCLHAKQQQVNQARRAPCTASIAGFWQMPKWQCAVLHLQHAVLPHAPSKPSLSSADARVQAQAARTDV